MTKIIIDLDKGIFSREKEEIILDEVEKIKNVILLNKTVDMYK
ncbi:hypothetical protein ALNOE001_21860 [Candidatus Methanobinarius endosymbioticus]|uniref:Uncharacterized protein n=1 Tax=Candidatus Methanobinarius endosymbioticus TaxID=2006182 RepID=A0A366M866_9EURY|nr:hypothetical protein ALNOE001_21860 [Candidatus Methanobinarius endosymbioticus]